MAPGAMLCSALCLCPTRWGGRAGPVAPWVNVRPVCVRQTQGTRKTVLLQALYCSLASGAGRGEGSPDPRTGKASPLPDWPLAP